MSRNPFLEIFDNPAPDIPGTFWATVVGTSPLRVKRDTEPTLAVTPKTLERLEVGDRVLCLWERRQVIVLGKMGGTPEPEQAYPSANVARIDGRLHPLSGGVVPPSYTWDHTTNAISYTTIQVPVPFDPPFGWTFKWSVAEASRFIFAENRDRYPSGGTQAVNIIQINNTALGHLQRLNWQLVYTG